MEGIPPPISRDSEDVAWALQTADSLWKRNERVDAIVWLRRAAQSAGEVGDDERAVMLARNASELTDFVARHPAPPAIGTFGSIAPMRSNDASRDSLIPDLSGGMPDLSAETHIEEVSISLDLSNMSADIPIPSAPPSRPEEDDEPPTDVRVFSHNLPKPIISAAAPSPAIEAFPIVESLPPAVSKAPPAMSVPAPAAPTRSFAPNRPAPPAKKPPPPVPGRKAPPVPKAAGSEPRAGAPLPPRAPQAPQAPQASGGGASMRPRVPSAPSLPVPPPYPGAAAPQGRAESRVPISEPPISIDIEAAAESIRGEGLRASDRAPAPVHLVDEPAREEITANADLNDPEFVSLAAPLSSAARDLAPKKPQFDDSTLGALMPGPRASGFQDTSAGAMVPELKLGEVPISKGPVSGVPSAGFDDDSRAIPLVRPASERPFRAASRVEAPASDPLPVASNEDVDEDSTGTFEHPPELIRQATGETAGLVDLSAIEVFSDLPDDARDAFAAEAELHHLGQDEEVSDFALALVLEGEFDVAATIVDASAERIRAGAVLRSQGTIGDPMELRLIGTSAQCAVATWNADSVERAFRTCPWVAEDLASLADRTQALVGVTMGPLAERLDAELRQALTDSLEVKRLEPGEVLIEQGKGVPGILLLGVGELEFTDGDEVKGIVERGSFVFGSEVLGGGKAPFGVRARSEGAVLLTGSRMKAQELLMTCPPLLEILAGI